MIPFLEYEVCPGANVPSGLPRQHLSVLSPIWRGPALSLEYPDGEVHNLRGWTGSGPGGPCDLQVFWTRHRPGAPAVCLAIGGDAGVRLDLPRDSQEPTRGLPFLALAESMIPAKVRAVIGSRPEPEEPAPLLLS